MRLWVQCSILPMAGFRAFGYLDWGCVTGEIYTCILKWIVQIKTIQPVFYLLSVILFFGSRPYKWVVTAEWLKFSAIYKQGKGHYDYLKLILHNWILYFHFIDPFSVWPEVAPFKTQTYTSDFFQVEFTPGDFIVHISVLLQCSLCFQGFHT